MLLEKFNKIFCPESPSEIKRAHFLKAVGIGALLVFGVSLFVLNFWNADQTISQPMKSEAKPTSIESAASQADIEEVARFKMSNEINTLRNQVADVVRMMAENTQKNETPDSNRIKELETRILELEMDLNTQNETQQVGHSSQLASQDSPDGDNERTGQIQKFTLNLTQNPKGKPLKNIKNTLPTGAFVKSILLSGLDASSSMNASSDPRPMLLRILDPGVLPRRFKSDLKDCHCTASAYGDLSSERVYARLEKLSCIETATGNIIETQVAGFIAGSDGRAGIRGVVVSKDGQFLGRSLLGGVFAGLSNVANPQNREAQVNPFFAGNPKIEAPSMGKMFSSGMATGATSALDRLSQYYIDRAEQLQPVIQVAAGQEVDIVFTEGITFGSEDVKEKIEAERSSSKAQVSSTSSSPPTLYSEENQE